MLNRFSGAFSYFNTSVQLDDEYSDSGHMEQSIETTKIFFDKVNTVFWGAGFGNRPYFIEGQAEDNDEFKPGYEIAKCCFPIPGDEVLGFHINDVGFQSPNVEAARPLVYATALLLVIIIALLNFSAVSLRNHLREKYRALEM